MNGIEFLSPGLLWLLPALIVATLLWRKSSADDGRAEKSTMRASRFLSPTFDLRVRHPLIAKLAAESTTEQHTVRFRIADAVVTWLVLGCLVLALAEPVRTGSRIPDPPAQRDITFIVDASVSMLLRDYILDGERIDRMSFLKRFLDRFVSRLHGDRISVIVFGDSAYTLLPLTDDQALTRRMLARIRTTMAGRFNALGEAITLAVKEADKNPQRRRILVLFTDADSSTDNLSPTAAAELAREAELPLYTIAIGAASYDAAEEELAGLIYHPANIALLQELAAVTGAESYQAGDNSALEDAINNIDQRERYQKEIPPRYFRLPLYPLPLFAGLLILSLYQLLRLARSQRQ